MSDKQIQDWQEKVRSNFGDEGKLYEYLFETMNNFYFRYLETTTDKDLKTTALGASIWGAQSIESSMVDALKISNPVAKKGIIELAKTFPKALGPKVTYELSAKIEELTSNRGKIKFTGKIDWGFPEFVAEEKICKKVVVFEYSDLTQFRKELALKLEECCSIFL